ncbi:MAG: zinc ribbon domain-containing protein [Propionibacteriaceae bacterium]|jgi:hypothetical protein|nr:zinc ribbon domain-containing protein [Propionibacteriaceae bacterium]
MLQSFTRNHQDDSAEAGFQFTFYCDICRDGYKSSFIESETYKKKGLLRGLGQGASILGSVLGGRLGSLGYSADRASTMLSQSFEPRSPEWLKEHEQAFERCQNEAKEHFHRCPNCNSYACDHCHNEDAGLCVTCAPRQAVCVAQAHAAAMKRNIDQAGQTTTVWQDTIEAKTAICPACGKPAGAGKFCNNCGTSMAMATCPQCGSDNSRDVRFCNNCGHKLGQAASTPGPCPSCGHINAPDAKFCGGCGGSHNR